MASNIEKLKSEIIEYKAIEKFMLECNDRDERLKAFHREGAIVNGVWVNDVESEEEPWCFENSTIDTFETDVCFCSVGGCHRPNPEDFEE